MGVSCSLQPSREASLPSPQRRGEARQGGKNRGCAKAAVDLPCCVQEQRTLSRARGGSDLTFNTASYLRALRVLRGETILCLRESLGTSALIFDVEEIREIFLLGKGRLVI